MISIRSLEWRNGRFNRGLWRRLLLAIAERTVKGGRNIRLRHTCDGVVVRSVGGDSDSDPLFPWQMSLQDNGDETWGLNFLMRGLVNGTEAYVGENPMSYTDPDTGAPNRLTITQDDFSSDDSVCRIYAKIAVTKTWTVDRVDIVALAKTPSALPWTDFMLVGLLIMDDSGAVTVEQHKFFDIQWAAGIQGTATGTNGFATYYRGSE